MAKTQQAASQEAYYVPSPSAWPLVGSSALFSLALGAALTVNQMSAGWYLLGLGFAILIYMLFGWFGQVVGESESGKYGDQVDMSFRWSMSWFIFSEVLFFSAFFGALYYARVISMPDLGSEAQKLLWPAFTAAWPLSAAPMLEHTFKTVGAWGVPAVNTLILLTSGLTVTLSHWGIVKGNRKQFVGWLAATVLLGMSFLYFQASEYLHAIHHYGLTLSSGVYGSTFYMLTGFHGLHVTLGTLMLLVILIRGVKGHFTPERHFAFEAAAWYWHFVDVVWLGLFIFVYWL